MALTGTRNQSIISLSTAETHQRWLREDLPRTVWAGVFSSGFARISKSTCAVKKESCFPAILEIERAVAMSRPFWFRLAMLEGP
jgi:hypothetical protein